MLISVIRGRKTRGWYVAAVGAVLGVASRSRTVRSFWEKQDSESSDIGDYKQSVERDSLFSHPSSHS